MDEQLPELKLREKQCLLKVQSHMILYPLPVQ